jgi:hypothetical protein
MKMENQKTLLTIVNHPLRRAAPFSISASMLGKRLMATNKSQAVSPDEQALRFYALNQIIGMLSTKFTPNQPLPEWAERAVKLYSEELYSQHRRMVWYTFLVISREWRHLKNLATVSSGPTKSALYPAGMKALHPHINDSTGEATLNSWLKHVPPIPLERYCAALTHSFNTGSWSGGYGGKPWGLISKTLQDYVGGLTSGEMFIDTAYTLAHNNGPMFNKGMLYGMYSHEFSVILDIQRSGQVAESIIEGQYTNAGSDVTQVVHDAAKDLNLGSYVDWYKVESLGALQQYPHKKVAQDKKYGKKPTEPKLTVKDGKAIKITGKYEWYPEKEVDIYTRMTATA